MNHYRLSDFHVGEEVWISGVVFNKSGRAKCAVLPFRTRVSEVDNYNISIEQGHWYFGNKFYDLPLGNRCTINDFVSKTKEESLNKYNQGILNFVNKQREELLNVEYRAKKYLI